MSEKWRKTIDSGTVVAVLFTDFSYLLLVSHPILLKKLSACGVSGDFLSYAESYLSNRDQFTVVNNVKSTPADVEFGSP